MTLLSTYFDQINWDLFFRIWEYKDFLFGEIGKAKIHCMDAVCLVYTDRDLAIYYTKKQTTVLNIQLFWMMIKINSSVLKEKN